MVSRFLHPGIDLDRVLQSRAAPGPNEQDLRAFMAANVAHYHVQQLEARLSLIRQLCSSGD